MDVWHWITRSVPAGIYGIQTLQSLKPWKQVARKVADAEDARAALALVALGEAPLGIVYKTDASAIDDVKIIGVFSATPTPCRSRSTPSPKYPTAKPPRCAWWSIRSCSR